MDILIKRLDCANLPPEYYSFLLEYYSSKEKDIYSKRQLWYQKSGDYKLYVAYLGTKIVGQASAYRCEAVICNKVHPWFWGVDTFALNEYRGLGIGKKLQNELHESCQNFSSAWYSPVNGFIKDKCGAINLFDISFYYYPVSVCFFFHFRMLLRKIVKRDFEFMYGLFPIHMPLKSRNRDFSASVNEEIISEEHLYFINSILNKHDFYIKRTKEFLYWKYEINPSLIVNQLVLRKGRVLAGILYFSDIYKTKIHGVSLNCVKLLDVFIQNKTDIKVAINCILSFFSSKGIRVDGVVSIMKMESKFGVSYYHNPLKSTYSGSQINKPYLTFIDQDMEQIF